MIGKLILDTLKLLGVPITFQTYSGSATTYITYFCYNEQGEAWAENKEIATGFYVQVDIWSKGDYINLVDQVKAAMEAAGFGDCPEFCVNKVSSTLHKDGGNNWVKVWENNKYGNFTCIDFTSEQVG